MVKRQILIQLVLLYLIRQKRVAICQIEQCKDFSWISFHVECQTFNTVWIVMKLELKKAKIEFLIYIIREWKMQFIKSFHCSQIGNGYARSSQMYIFRKFSPHQSYFMYEWWTLNMNYQWHFSCRLHVYRTDIRYSINSILMSRLKSSESQFMDWFDSLFASIYSRLVCWFQPFMTFLNCVISVNYSYNYNYSAEKQLKYLYFYWHHSLTMNYMLFRCTCLLAFKRHKNRKRPCMCLQSYRSK